MNRYVAVTPIGKPGKLSGPGWPAGAILTDKDLPAETIQELLRVGLLKPYEEPKKEEGKK